MRKYLGDGVYVKYTGEEIILSTSDGINTTNKIYLNVEILSALSEFIKKIYAHSAVISQTEVDKMSLGLDDNGWEK